MSATCPACGVAVVPGYVKCPKCHRPLPTVRRLATVAGGTSVSGGGGLPILPIVGGAIAVLAIILYFALRDDDSSKPATTAPVTDETAEAPVPQPTNPVPQPTSPATPRQVDDVNRVDPNATARDLERVLQNRRLWSSVEIIGSDIEVRSGSCRDANMIPTVDAARAALRNAGLTRLRCLENSGAVVFERQL